MSIVKSTPATRLTNTQRRRRSWADLVKLLILSFMCWTVLVMSAHALDLDAGSRDALAVHPVVTIGIVADNEPYSWVEGGQVSGFSVDVLEEIARHTGLRFEYRAGSWPEIYPAFLRGEIDAIDEISYREDRAALMLFTEPYHFRQTVIMHDSARPLPALRSLDDLAPYRIGIVRDIYYKNAFTRRGLAVTEYDGLPNLVRALAFGWIDAIAGPEVTLVFLARKAGFGHLAVAGRPAMDGFETEDFRIAVRPEHATLHRILDAGLSAIPRQRLAELVETWQEFGGKAITTPQGFRLSEPHATYVRRLGPVRVGIMRDYAPFSFLDGGKLQGLSVDMLSRVQGLTGLQVIPVADRWSVLLELFRRGEIDVIANISDNEQRRDYARFTEPYYVIPNAVFTRDGAFRYDSNDRFEGLRVALTAGIFYESRMRERFGDTIVAFSAQDAMFQALAEGSVDVVLSALPNGNHWVRELGLTDVRIAGEFRLDDIAGEDLRFGVRPALEPLAHIIDMALAAISPTERRTIENRWMGAATSPVRSDDATGAETRITLSDIEQTYLAKRGHRITACIDPDWMPLEGFDRHGRHVGMSAELLALFGARLDVSFETLRTASWSESIEAVKARRCDLIPLAMQTPERLAYLSFTSSYYTIPNVLLARVEVPFIDGLDELEDRPVGIVRGHAFAELLRIRYPRLQLIEVDNEIDGLRRLQRGEIHAYVSTLLSASYHLQELGLADIKVIGRVPGDWALSVATRNDEPMLLAVAQKMIDSLTDADRRGIEDKWRTVPLERQTDYTLIWKILAGALAAVALLSLWNRKLGSLNRQLAEANSQLARLSVTDSLTGLGNREFFDQTFGKSFRWCQRHSVGFVVAMIDIDHFKHINDSYGHKAGDDCLRALAQCLQAHSRRETDRIARIGGEEFVAFSTYEDADEACARFDALRAAAQDLRVPGTADEISLTISIGVAFGIPSPADHAEAFLARADRALYQAKHAGRNRTVCERASAD